MAAQWNAVSGHVIQGPNDLHMGMFAYIWDEKLTLLQSKRSAAVQYMCSTNTSCSVNEISKLRTQEEPENRKQKSTDALPELHSPGERVLSEAWLRSHKLCDKTPSSAKPSEHSINHTEMLEEFTSRHWVIDKLEEGKKALFSCIPSQSPCPSNKPTTQQES